MSDQSFAAIEAMLATDESRVQALTYENTRLKEMINSMRLIQPLPLPPPVDETTLQFQLNQSLHLQETLQTELNLLKEDQTGELTVLRTSLAILASELELEKARTTPPSQTKEEAIAAIKAAALRSNPDEMRRALAKMKNSSPNLTTAPRRTSYGGTFMAPKQTIPMRRVSSASSSYGKVHSIGEEEPVVGLGLAVSSNSSSLSSSSSTTSRPRMTDRSNSEGGYANISSRESWDEDDKSAKLRYARLGITTTKIGGLVSPVMTGPSIDSLVDMFEPERRRIPSISTTSPSSETISLLNTNSPELEHEEGQDFDSPLLSQPVPLVKTSRNQSYPVFESNPMTNNRRNSSATSEEISARFSSFLIASSNSSNSTSNPLPSTYAPSPRSSLPALPPSPLTSPLSIPNTTTSDHSKLLNELEVLKNALAESEEGRLASERCLRSLKEYIVASPGGTTNLLLPPSPSRTRWVLPRLPSIPSLGRKPSTESLSPLPPTPLDLPASSTYTSKSNLTSFKSNAITRRVSTSSMTQSTYNREKALPPPVITTSPIFGGFSFASLVRSPSPLAEVEEIEVSPRMKHLNSLNHLDSNLNRSNQLGIELEEDDLISAQRRRSSGIRHHRTREEGKAVVVEENLNSDSEEEEEHGSEEDGIRSMESMMSDTTSSDGSSRPSSPNNNNLGRVIDGNDIIIWEDVALSGRNDTQQVKGSQRDRLNTRASTGRSHSIY